MSNISCKTCAKSIYDDTWGDYKCVKKQRSCTESEVAMGCDLYEKHNARPNAHKPEIVVRSGATFYPHVSSDGVLTWTNDKGLPNPEPIKLSSDPDELKKMIDPVTGDTYSLSVVDGKLIMNKKAKEDKK